MATQLGSLSDRERDALILPLYATYGANEDGSAVDDNPMSAIERMQSQLAEDPNDEDSQVMLGLVQGVLDVAANQRAHDKWDREQIANWNPGYAIGYQMGSSHATKLINTMRGLKRRGFGGAPNSTQFYGREGMRRAQG